MPKIAVQTRMWGNERIREEFPVIFDEAIRAGYDGVECNYVVADNEEELRRYLDAHRLQLAALHANLAMFDPASGGQGAEALLKRMERIGVEFLLVSAGRPKDPEARRRGCELAAKATEQCRRHGVRLCYHNHDWEFADGFAFFDEMTDEYGIDLAADLAWVHRAGYRPEAFVERYASRIRYVHLKDTQGKVWKELGRGEVDLLSALRRLSGLKLPWWTVEQDDTEREAKDSAAISREYLRQYFNSGGFNEDAGA